MTTENDLWRLNSRLAASVNELNDEIITLKKMLHEEREKTQKVKNEMEKIKQDYYVTLDKLEKKKNKKNNKNGCFCIF